MTPNEVSQSSLSRDSSGTCHFFLCAYRSTLAARLLRQAALKQQSSVLVNSLNLSRTCHQVAPGICAASSSRVLQLPFHHLLPYARLSWYQSTSSTVRKSYQLQATTAFAPLSSRSCRWREVSYRYIDIQTLYRQTKIHTDVQIYAQTYKYIPI